MAALGNISPSIEELPLRPKDINVVSIINPYLAKAKTSMVEG
jgi:hypothetical protein